MKLDCGMSIDTFDKTRARLDKALGKNYRLTPGFEPCDAAVKLPSPMRGGVAVCLNTRRWCPGGGQHGAGIGSTEWFGIQTVNPERYKGRGWIERMAEDIKTACQAGVEDMIENHPNWMAHTTPELARENVS